VWGGRPEEWERKRITEENSGRNMGVEKGRKTEREEDRRLSGWLIDE
jgi:hypothetical protein